MARKFSGKVFDRPANTEWCSQRITTDLAALAGDVDPVRRALGANVESDWRVSPEREQHFCDSFRSNLPPDEQPQDIGEMLKDFYGKQIRGTASPDFLRRHNHANQRNEINKDTFLVSAFCFPELPQVVQPGAMAVARGGLLEHAGVVAVLQEIFPIGPFQHHSTGRSMLLDHQQKLFLAGCFLRETKPNYHPAWTGLWNEFLPFVDLGPDSWLAAFGVRPQRTRLCLLLRYQITALNNAPVYMPTYLESNCCAEHFPSPPSQCAWQNGSNSQPLGGHPMSLRPETDRGPVLQEFIHEDFMREPDMVFAWGWTGGKDSARDVEQARKIHYSRLERHYFNLKNWLEEPI